MAKMCSTCKYWFKIAEDSPFGQCKRFPPEVMLAPVKAFVTPNIMISNNRPQTEYSDIRGEYKAIEE